MWAEALRKDSQDLSRQCCSRNTGRKEKKTLLGEGKGVGNGYIVGGSCVLWFDLKVRCMLGEIKKHLEAHLKDPQCQDNQNSVVFIW